MKQNLKFPVWRLMLHMHEEDIIVLRNIPHLDSSFQIEIYSRNGNIWNIYPLPGNVITVDPCDTCLLSNPKAIVAVIQEGQYMFDNGRRSFLRPSEEISLKLRALLKTVIIVKPLIIVSAKQYTEHKFTRRNIYTRTQPENRPFCHLTIFV